ncbi:MAG: hypothetical protein AB1556_08680 [Bacillota bacterium]
MVGVKKMVRKGSVWWKHGRHKGLAGAAAYFNHINEVRKKCRFFDPLDISRPDWSRRGQVPGHLI